MEQYICPSCGGFCKQSKLHKEKRICTNCNTIYDDFEVTIKTYYKQSWDRKLDQKQKQIVIAELQGVGLSQGQIKQIMMGRDMFTEQELMIMKELGVGLPTVQRAIIDAQMLGFVTLNEKNEVLSEE